MSKVTIEMKEKEVKKPTLHRQLHTSQQGITLIALVITIIVMLILVSVTISMAINGGLFEYAGKATGDTKNAINAEQQLANGHIVVDGKEYASIDDFLEGKEYVPTYDNASKDENGILKENATYTSGEYTAVIPAGFKIIPGLNNTTTIADGLVIQDASGNEFVWIPVTFTVAEGSQKDENGLYPEFLAEFYRSNWSGNARGTTRYTADSSYTEPCADGYEGEDTEYYEMMRSVQDNKGFYIGRYEAGSQKEDENGNLVPTARTDTANETSKVVVKRDQYPYIYVGWGAGMSDYTSDVGDDGKGALYLCKHMYDEQDIGATSTLCYGIQWDAMLDFIKDDTHNVTNSTSWGNYSNSTWTIDRTTAKWTATPGFDTTWTEVTADGKSKTSSESILLTTGADDSFCAKNIYDVAGNVYEWTNEADSSVARVIRSGYFNGFGPDVPASRRNGYNPTACNYNVGFRPALYIK